MTDKEKSVSIQFYAPESLRTRLKILCAKRETSMKALLIELIESELNKDDSNVQEPK